jgi:glycosyltransferase involved in cell wall biosynthesis
MTELSVVVPVYGCEGCLKPLYERVTAAVREITDEYELVFVDDRSPDNSWDVLQGLAREDPSVRIVRLSRNFGQHPAITAGLARAKGEWVVVMDCDLEDPPEEIPKLFAKASEGYDAVLCRRAYRRQSLSRRLGAKVYRRLANALARTDIDPDYTNLSIISRKVVNAFLTLGDLDRQYLLIVLWLGFEHATIDVDQNDRYAGRSSYRFRELIRVAMDGIVFQTNNLLNLIIYGGSAIALGGILAGGGLLIYAYSVGDPPPGWASLAVLTMLLTGVIVVSTGITGLYVGKIFRQVKGRPLYVVDVDINDRDDRAPGDEGSERVLEVASGEESGQG